MKPFDTFDIPEKGEPEALHGLFVKDGVAFKQGKKIVEIEAKIPAQVPLIILIAESGLRGLIRVPARTEECSRVYQEYANFVHKRKNRILEMIEERTSDEELQQKIYAELFPRLVKGT